MKILFLCNKLPHSEVAGGHRIIFQRIRHLANAGHQISLLTFTSSKKEEKNQSLKPFLTELQTVELPRRNIVIRALHDYLAWSRPAVFWKSYSKKMMRKLGEMVEKGRYDIVIAEFSEMGQYLHKNPYLPAVNKIISCHRCVTASYEKYKELGEVKWRLYLKSLPQVRGLEKYEFEMYRSADRTLVLTPPGSLYHAVLCAGSFHLRRLFRGGHQLPAGTPADSQRADCFNDRLYAGSCQRGWRRMVLSPHLAPTQQKPPGNKILYCWRRTQPADEKNDDG